MSFLPRLNNDITSDKRILLSGSLYTIVIKIFAIFIAFGVQAVLARQLGTSSFGAYTYLLTWAVLIGQFACLGFDTSLVRYISAYRASSDWKLLGGVIRFGYLLPLGVSVVLALFFVAFIYFQVITISTVDTKSMLLAGILIPFLTMALIRQSTLRALKHVVFAQIPDSIIRPIILVIVTSIWFWGSDTFLELNKAFIAHVLAAIAALVLGTYFVFRVMPKVTAREYLYSHWLTSSMPLLFASAMTMLMSKTDIIMIGILVSPKDSGIYAVASQFSELTSFGLIAANTVLAPIISGLYATSDHAKLQSVVTLTTRLGSVFAISVSLILVIFGKNILELFGSDFVAGYVSLCILLAGQIFNVISGSVGVILNMTGHESFAARIIFVVFILNIILNALLIPMYGAFGAAIATAVSVMAWNAAMVIFIGRRLKINTTVFASNG